MRLKARAKLVVLFATASLLAMIHSQVRAQADDIPETVPVTGSLRDGVDTRAIEEPLSPMNKQLTQLTDDELNAILPGATIRPTDRSLLWYLSVNCDGSYQFLGGRGVISEPSAYIPPVETYWILDNRFCLSERQTNNFGCYRVFRSRAGIMFSDVYESGRAGLRLVEITPPPPDRACVRR